MPEFSYSARSKDGQITNDVIVAPSKEAVGEMLREQGLLPTLIVEKKQPRFSFAQIRRLFAHVSLLEKLTFIKNLAVTLQAGLPVSRALKVVTEQMPNPYFKKVIGEITHSVESGKSLAESMSEYPKVFSGIIVNMIKVGEASGDLDETLKYLSTQLSRDHELIRRTKGALLYPAVVLVTLVVIGYLMFVFVLPKLTETFAEFDTELPALTRGIIGVVDFVSSYAILIAILAIGLIVGLVFWSRTKSGKHVLNRLILKIPVIGKITKEINLARFTIIFSGLLHSGMSIVEALRVSGQTLRNVHYQNALNDSSEKVKVGVDLRLSLENYPELFTPMVTQMVQVGEESGTMADVLAEVSHFYEAEVDDSVKSLSSIIEPVLVIIIGVVVGILAVGLILPIYNIGSSI